MKNTTAFFADSMPVAVTYNLLIINRKNNDEKSEEEIMTIIVNIENNK